MHTRHDPPGPVAGTGSRYGEGAISISQVGEFGLIDRIVAKLGPPGGAVLIGPGDDAAVVAAPEGRVVASTDAFVDGRHFRRDWCTAEDVGHRVAAQTMADAAAMGATPTALLVAMACPADLQVSWVEEFATGLVAECAEAGAMVAGGDVVRGDTLVLTGTVIGDLGGRAPVTRAGALPGDLVAVAGRLGWAAAGLAVLGRGFRSPAAVVAAYRRPRPPSPEGPRAAALGATAMCDVSDGLVQDLGHIAAASGVLIELDSATFDVPERLRDVAAALGADPMAWLLGGGEDHALVATFPAGQPLADPWIVVGRVLVAADSAGVLLDGEPYDVGGFDHFSAG
ncbi:MAG: thiamine-phosphate kinase [Mycobacteriales bacterium]